jgi:hypothetical protein
LKIKAEWEASEVRIQTLGAGRDSDAGCAYCGAKPFGAYRRYGLPLGQFSLPDHDAVVCGECLNALQGLHAAGSVTLETLACQHENWSDASDEGCENEIFLAVAEDLVNQIRFPDGPPEDWSERDPTASTLMVLAIDRMMQGSSAAHVQASAGSRAQ